MKYKIFIALALAGSALAELLGGMGPGAADTGDLYGCGLDHGRDTSSGGIPKKPEIP